MDNIETKICMICHANYLKREMGAVLQAFESVFSLTTYFVDEKWPVDISEIKGYRDYDVIIWFVRFRELIRKTAIKWRDYNGVRILYDWDAYQDFSPFEGTRFLGAWAEVFRKNEFHVLACTGKATRDHLFEQGVNAHWIPKAYDKDRFFDKGGHRKGACYFGELYKSRAAMLHYLKKKGIKYERFRCSVFELNDYLNRYEMCLICNMVVRPGKGVKKLINRFIPGYGTELHPGPEVMAKHFEAAASGCVPFCDEIPEHEDLGFKDGETMVSYKDFDELGDKIRHYSASEDLLSEIRNNATKLCVEKHTWHHRAEAFKDLINQHK